MKIIMRMYLIVLIITLVLAFMFAVPSMKAQQMAACDMLESGLSQINPQANYEYPPQTAEECKYGVEQGWFNRGFIGVIGSAVVAVFATLLIVVILSAVFSSTPKAAIRRKPKSSH